MQQRQSDIPPAPSVYRYLDYREWLQDWFRWKKLRTPTYSHRLFARVSGLAVGTLHNILSGRRSPNPESVERIARATRLSAEEEVFFTDLVRLAETTDLKARNDLLERVLGHDEVREVRRLEGRYVTYLSNWYHVAIRELARLPDFSRDPAWIVARLAHRVDVEQVRAALETLLELGLLVEDEAGRLLPAEIRLETPASVSGLAFFRHHEEMLSLGAQALRTIPAEERYYGAVTLTVPAARVGELRNEILAFLRSTMNRLDQPGAPPECVYQLNVQLFPLAGAAPANAAENASDSE